MKLRRSEYRRRRKIRQRARKRWPVNRHLDAIFGKPIWAYLIEAEKQLLDAILVEGKITDGLLIGGRYIENTFHFEVTPAELR